MKKALSVIQAIAKSQGTTVDVDGWSAQELHLPSYREEDFGVSVCMMCYAICMGRVPMKSPLNGRLLKHSRRRMALMLFSTEVQQNLILRLSLINAHINPYLDDVVSGKAREGAFRFFGRASETVLRFDHRRK
jgi:hypothetical protein